MESAPFVIYSYWLQLACGTFGERSSLWSQRYSEYCRSQACYQLPADGLAPTDLTVVCLLWHQEVPCQVQLPYADVSQIQGRSRKTTASLVRSYHRIAYKMDRGAADLNQLGMANENSACETALLRTEVHALGTLFSRKGYLPRNAAL